MTPEIANIIVAFIDSQDSLHEKIRVINEMKALLHQHSPFNREPVDCVLWVRQETVEANDYNPNVMATAEKRLLEYSIVMDGFTQPIVTARQDNRHLVVDGFHRHLTSKSSPSLKERLHGYLPVTHVSTARQGQRERIAATIRHNRARGKHQINTMCDIVRDLYRLGWSDQQIGTELGMSPDEVLRLKQINGLAELFADEEYSQAWTVG
ncbi:ParB/RepB/Spo0J family partition protein [Enterobacter cancerogenus]